MARYKEQWEDFDSPVIVGYIDTEHALGRFLPTNSQEVADWITAGGVPDPAFTAEEIAAAEAAATAADARAYVLDTDSQVASYVDRKAAKLAGRVNTLKYKSLQRKRAVAFGRV